MKSLLIIYNCPAKRKRSKLLTKLDEDKEKHNWFNYCVLQNNEATIFSILKPYIPFEKWIQNLSR